MNLITKWSQSILISLILYIIASFLIFLEISVFSTGNKIFSVAIFIIITLVFWGLSHLLKLKNSTISSALFITGSIFIFSSLTSLVTGLLFSFIFWVISFILPIILFKYIYETSWGRAIWLIIINGIVLSILITVSLFIIQSEINKKTVSEQVNPSSYISDNIQTDTSINNKENTPIKNLVDPLLIQKAKEKFPTGFPFPEDSTIISAQSTESMTIRDTTIPSNSTIVYITKEETSKILEFYTNAIKTQGLRITNDISESGQQGVLGIGDKVKVGVDDQISAIIKNLPDGSKEISLHAVKN